MFRITQTTFDLRIDVKKVDVAEMIKKINSITAIPGMLTVEVSTPQKRSIIAVDKNECVIHQPKYNLLFGRVGPQVPKKETITEQTLTFTLHYFQPVNIHQCFQDVQLISEHTGKIIDSLWNVKTAIPLYPDNWSLHKIDAKDYFTLGTLAVMEIHCCPDDEEIAKLSEYGYVMPAKLMDPDGGLFRTATNRYITGGDSTHPRTYVYDFFIEFNPQRLYYFFYQLAALDLDAGLTANFQRTLAPRSIYFSPHPTYTYNLSMHGGTILKVANTLSSSRVEIKRTVSIDGKTYLAHHNSTFFI